MLFLLPNEKNGLVKKNYYPTHTISPLRLHEKFEGKWVIVTGASRGIGYELTQL